MRNPFKRERRSPIDKIRSDMIQVHDDLVILEAQKLEIEARIHARRRWLKTLAELVGRTEEARNATL